jgi:hypothetical protein
MSGGRSSDLVTRPRSVQIAAAMLIRSANGCELVRLTSDVSFSVTPVRLKPDPTASARRAGLSSTTLDVRPVARNATITIATRPAPPRLANCTRRRRLSNASTAWLSASDAA